eukprot:12246930-Heterocapsa_arctica.AAC.1
MLAIISQLQSGSVPVLASRELVVPMLAQMLDPRREELGSGFDQGIFFVTENKPDDSGSTSPLFANSSTKHCRGSPRLKPTGR